MPDVPVARVVPTYVRIVPVVPVVPVVLVTYACECLEMACFGKGVFLMGLASERAR